MMAGSPSKVRPRSPAGRITLVVETLERVFEVGGLRITLRPSVSTLSARAPTSSSALRPEYSVPSGMMKESTAIPIRNLPRTGDASDILATLAGKPANTTPSFPEGMSTAFSSGSMTALSLSDVALGFLRCKTRSSPSLSARSSVISSAVCPKTVNPSSSSTLSTTSPTLSLSFKGEVRSTCTMVGGSPSTVIPASPGGTVTDVFAGRAIWSLILRPSSSAVSESASTRSFVPRFSYSVPSFR
mmetsp:Transcript_19877/g.36124  ORF Transcript_19877/g.36124 Transcript_19877/m.36124 type:complete len:243 (+) Transcript_19877:1249-1977(+)